MLAPHDRKYAKFGQVRGAPEDRDRPLELLGGEPISAANFGVTLEPREVVIPAVAGGGVVRIALNAPGASNELRPR